ncbi:MAG: transglutaminase-like domain-containing protein [Myxococcota bacterium]
MIRLPSSLLALVLWLSPSELVSAAPAEELWYDFNFHGSKVGFLQAIDEPTTWAGKPALHFRRHSVITVRRAAEVIRMESDTDAWSDTEGHPLHFVHVRDEGGAKRHVEGTVDGGMMVIKSNVGGTLGESKVPIGEGVYFSSGLDWLLKRDLKLGKKASGKALIEEDGVVQPFTAEVTGTKDVEQGKAFVLKSVVAGIESEDWVLAGGKTVRTSAARMGAEYVLTTREKAMAVLSLTDIFTATELHTHVILPKTERLDDLTVLLTGRSGRPPRPIADERQIVQSTKGGQVQLKVLAQSPPTKSEKLPNKNPKLARYLSATQYEALSDDRIVSTARDVVAGATDAWTAARRINAFVHKRIEKKSLAQAFSTAIEALESKEGDCTEHAVLFSALAKAAGIPTRLITGIVYVGTNEGTFGYHEWVEVSIGGVWIAMDPTFGEDLASPAHVKFSQGLSDPDGLRDAGLVAAELFGDLDLGIVGYTVDGKKTTL